MILRPTCATPTVTLFPDTTIFRSHGGVLTAREENDRAFELACHLSEDVDRVGLEGIESIELCAVELRPRRCQVNCHDACNPHSVLEAPAQRPLRGSLQGAGLLVQGAQPMDGYP